MELCEITTHHRSQIMGFAMLSIMIFHQCFINNIFVNNTFGLYGNYGVDVFLFVSGFGCSFSLDNHNIIAFYNRRVKRLIPACILIGLFRVILTEIAPTFMSSCAIEEHSRLSYNWMSFFSFDLWYIRAIIILYLFCPIIYLLCDRVNPLLLVTVTTIISVIFIYVKPDAFIIDWIAPRLLVFILGVLVAKYRLVLTLPRVILSTIFLIVAVLFKLLQAKWHLFTVPIDLNYLFFAFAIPVVVIGIAKLCDQSRILSNLLSLIGVFTLEIYLCHEFIYKCVFNTIVNFDLPIIYGFIPALIISLAIAWLMHQILKFKKCLQSRATLY